MKEYGRKNIDLKERAECREDKMETLNELGEKFLQDKSAIEERIKKIKELCIPDEKKTVILAEAEDMLRVLEEQYEKDVTEEQKSLSKEAEEDSQEAIERAQELEDLSKSLREAKMEAAKVDLRSLTEMTEQQRTELLERNAETVQRMQEMQADARLQRESIRQRPEA